MGLVKFHADYSSACLQMAPDQNMLSSLTLYLEKSFQDVHTFSHKKTNFLKSPLIAILTVIKGEENGISSDIAFAVLWLYFCFLKEVIKFSIFHAA